MNGGKAVFKYYFPNPVDLSNIRAKSKSQPSQVGLLKNILINKRKGETIMKGAIWKAIAFVLIIILSGVILYFSVSTPSG